MPRTALVTGTNRGLGLEFVKDLSRRGYHVIATVRDMKHAAAVTPFAKRVLPLEQADPASIHALGEVLAGVPIDVLVNNAGMSAEDKSVSTLSMEAFEKVFRTNAFGPALLTRALLPNLRAAQTRRVLNISSTLGSITNVSHGFSYAYRASKSALNMLTASLARELGPEGFTIVTFCPGWNKTDMGGPAAPLDPADSVRKLLDVAEGLNSASNGTYLSHEGKPIAW
ncbi:MAG: SDR family oxidoreductase [Planctomycetota bacterium]|nr:SDR family oxidoreductase [Planctomycetota bacterium]